MRDAMYNLILEAAFFGLPAIMTAFFAVWMIHYECRKGA